MNEIETLRKERGELFIALKRILVGLNMVNPAYITMKNIVDNVPEKEVLENICEKITPIKGYLFGQRVIVLGKGIGILREINGSTAVVSIDCERVHFDSNKIQPLPGGQL